MLHPELRRRKAAAGRHGPEKRVVRGLKHEVGQIVGIEILRRRRFEHDVGAADAIARQCEQGMGAERRRQVELRYDKAAVQQGQREAAVGPAIGCDIGEVDRVASAEIQDRVPGHDHAVDPQCLRRAGEECHGATTDCPRRLCFEGPAAEICAARIGICCRQHRRAGAALHNVAVGGNDARFNKGAAVPELQRAAVGNRTGHGAGCPAVAERQRS